MHKMLIEIWSDIACPYCYIGKKKLERALQQLQLFDNIEIKWYSFELDPSLPMGSTGVSYMQNIQNKTGRPIEAIEKGIERIKSIAAQFGLNYDFERIIVTNTSDALRLVKLASRVGLASEMEEALFSAYFIEGKCVSDPDTLISIGKKVGLIEQNVRNMLESEEFKDALKSDKETAKSEFDVQYIPFYRFNRSHLLQGSIDMETYVDTVQIAYREWEEGIKSKGSAHSGKACSIDGSGCE